MNDALKMLGDITIWLMLITGLVALRYGQWRPHALKYAAVALSTSAAFWLLGVNVILTQPAPVCGIKNVLCFTWSVYHVARNTAFILFHVAVGRDAIKLRSGDRRAQCSDLMRKP